VFPRASVLRGTSGGRSAPITHRARNCSCGVERSQEKNNETKKLGLMPTSTRAILYIATQRKSLMTTIGWKANYEKSSFYCQTIKEIVGVYP